MEKKIASGIMLTLLLATMLALAFNIQTVKAEPRTWIVDDDGPADFQTIQEAIDAADSGDTISVKAGTYYELVTINKNSLTLVGETKSTTVIDGSRLNSVVKIMANDICIKGFTIRNGGADYYGITLSNSMNNTISDNLISNNYGGIGLFYSPNNDIIGNLITTTSFSWTGVFLEASDYNTVSENRIERSTTGIYFFGVDNNVIENNILIGNSQYGLLLAYGSRNNTVRGNIIRESQNGIYFHQVFLANAIPNVFSNNEITDNDCGIYFFWSQNNVFFHNNITDNLRQVFMEQPFNNIWDDGYPSGGNYWSDYGTRYPDAQELDDSGIWDTPYVIDENNRDNYPLMEPWTPTSPSITASVNIDPDTLNLRSKGKWTTAYIQLPEGYNPEDIDASTILLNGTIQPVSDPKYGFVTNPSEYLFDHNSDGILERMVKFDRASVQSFILDQGIGYGNVALTIAGELLDGTCFEGRDTVFVNHAGDANHDGTVNVFDVCMVKAHWGTDCPDTDFNKDFTTNTFDILILKVNWNQATP